MRQCASAWACPFNKAWACLLYVTPLATGHLTFDPEDRLTMITGGGMAGPFSAGYDGDGLRAWKRGTLPGTSSAVTTYFLSDGGGHPVLEETWNGSSATLSAVNLWGADGWRARYSPGGQFYAFSFDPQGNVIQRQNSGNTLGYTYDTASYEAYGHRGADYALGGANPAPVQSPAGFGGQFGYYTDLETGNATAPGTGLLCLTHRYYDPGTGRFLTRDPSGYSGGVNLYGFAGDNPVNEIDPSGYAETPIDWALDAGAVVFDTGKLIYDNVHNASAAEVGVDRTALGLDGIGLLPIVPPGMGRAYALAHGGIEAVHAVQALRRAQMAAKAAQGVMMAAGLRPAGNGVWESPGGLRFGQGPNEHRVTHVMDHLGPSMLKPGKSPHSIFNLNGRSLVELLDEAWSKKGVEELQGNGNNRYIINMGRSIGMNGETNIVIITKPGTSDVITAFPQH